MRHFLEELEELQGRLLEMAGLVESSIDRSILAVTTREESYAREVLNHEARINQMEIEIDEIATRLLACNQPMARDLRLLTAAIKINNDLERMGDLSINIADRALSLRKQPAMDPQIDIPHMARLVQRMVRDSLDAFVKRDSALARRVLVSDDRVDEARDAIYTEMLDLMERDPGTIRRAFDYVFVSRNLERIADHATNIAEDVLFLIEGIDVRHHAETGL